MRLFLSPTSPFARKVKVALIEKNLLESLEEVRVDPWQSPPELISANPMSQVPTLVTDAGVVLGNSDMIIEWLERVSPNPPLLPGNAEELARVFSVAGLAHGVIESVVYVVIERRKPEAQQGAEMIARRLAGIERVLAVVEERFDASRERFMLDGLNLACALSYVDLREPEFDWRERCPRLAAWHEWAVTRPSLKLSAPPAR